MKYISLLILLIMLAAVFLVGGIFDYPRPKGIESSPPTTYVSQLAEIPGDPKKSLHLDALVPAGESGITPEVTCTSRYPAVNILVDTSNSIEGEIDQLRAALILFSRKLSPDDTFGIQEFGHGSATGRVVLPFARYGDDRARVESVINSITYSEDGDAYTLMKDGFQFAKQTIDNSSNTNYDDWVFLFFSDGHPKTADADSDPAQDPTDVAREMRNNGMRIITVSLGTDADRGLMRRLASSESDALHAANGGELESVFSSIALGCE